MAAEGRYLLVAAVLSATAALALLLTVAMVEVADAQRRQRAVPVPPPAGPAQAAAKDTTTADTGEGKGEAQDPALPAETVQADVSARNVAVTATFSGVEIVVFGAVDNSRQPSAESGLYDIVIVIEGAPTPMIARRKTNVGGLWLNTSSASFDGVPGFYAISSTRPLDEVAQNDILKHYDIGFDHVRMVLSKSAGAGPPVEELKKFREAVVRIKRREGLYQLEEYGVAFIGRSLFRASIELPANAPVGPFETRVYLFRQGQFLSSYTARLSLEREGFERLIHAAAFQRPLIYGVATVLIAIAAGLLASSIFTRARH